MKLLRVSDQVSLAFDMTWDGYDGITSSLNTQIRKWRDRDFVVACNYPRDGDVIYGLDSDRSKPDNNSRLISGAAILATHPALAGKTGLVILEVEQARGADPVAIVVGMRLGVVNLDRLVPLDEVPALRKHFMANLPSGKSLETWGQVHTLEAVDHAFSFKELVAAASARTRLGGSAAGSAEIVPLRTTNVAKVATALIALTAVTSMGWYFWDNYESEMEAVQRAKALAMSSPKVQYQKNIDLLLSTPIILAGPAIELVRDRFGSFPVFVAGWQLQSINCLAKSCDVTWERKQGTFPEFERAVESGHPDWQGLSLLSMDQLRHTVAIDMPKEKLPLLTTWPKARVYRHESLSHWQYLKPPGFNGWTGSISTAVQEALPAGLQPDQEAELRSFPGAPHSLTMDISNQQWFYASEDPLSPIKNLGETAALLGGIDLKFDGKELKFSFKAKVYVQN